MTEQAVRARARCEGCNKVFRVPDPDRTYACKSCGGTVRTIEELEVAREAVLEDALACSECGTVNDREASACVECGTSLLEDSAKLRQDATDALKRAYKKITAVTWLYRLGALAYAIATGFAVLALARTEIPVGPGVLVVGLTTLLSVLMLMGALHIIFKPFVWTVVIALLATAVSVVHWVGPNPLGIAFIASAAWAAVSWAVLVPTYRFRRLIAEHKDLYILHHASMRTRRSLKGRTPEERHARLVGVMHKAARRTWKISVLAAGVVVLASALGTKAILSNLRPQELSVAHEGFEVAWNDTDLAAVGTYFDARIRAQESTWLAGVTAGHGWGDALPRLENGRIQREEAKASVDYELDDFTLTANWALDGQEWSLVRVELPIPPLEPAFQRFLAAWRSSDPEAIAAFYSKQNRAVMLESIERSALQRGWIVFPEILETELSDYSEGDATADFSIEGGTVKSKWHLRDDGTWGMHGLKFPKR